MIDQALTGPELLRRLDKIDDTKAIVDRHCGHQVLFGVCHTAAAGAGEMERAATLPQSA